MLQNVGCESDYLHGHGHGIVSQTIGREREREETEGERKVMEGVAGLVTGG